MTCQDVIDRDLAEQYLLGRLSDPLREEFERHYFECDRCFADLEALRAVQAELRRRPGDARPAARPRRRHAPYWIAAAAAILLLVGGNLASSVRGIVRTLREPPGALRASRPPGGGDAARTALPEEVQRLARVTPPPASTTTLRSGPSRPAFAEGIDRYRRGDYAAAVPLLARALGDEPSAEDARFYLGASQLLAGQASTSITTLAPLTIRPSSAYSEEARFLTAKAELQRGDAARAADMLDRTIAMHGDREREAVALRAALASLAR